jgi:hypothetical protein
VFAASLMFAASLLAPASLELEASLGESASLELAASESSVPASLPGGLVSASRPFLSL